MLFVALLAVGASAPVMGQSRGKGDPPPTRNDNRNQDRGKSSPPPTRNDNRNKDRGRSTPPPTRNDNRNQDRGKSTPPPTRNNDRGKSSPPPTRNDNRNQDRGKSTPPPTKRDDNRDRNNTRGKSTPPPTRNDNRDQDRGKGTPPPTRNDNRDRGNTPPPTRNDSRDRDNSRDQGRSTSGGVLNRGGNDSRTSGNTRTDDRSRNNGVLTGGGTRTSDGRIIVPGRTDSQTSKSGQVSYGRGSNNNRSTGDVRSAAVIPPPPRVNSTIAREANRERGRINTRGDYYRSGYYHYDRGWHDSRFFYPHYVFSWQPRCYPSPVYYYPHLPGYIADVRVDLGFVRISWTQGSFYNWRYRADDWGYSSVYRTRDIYLDRAVDDIYDGFRRGDMRYIDDLIPYRGWINIEVDGSVEYRIGGEDFYDLMRDLIEGTDTVDYEIRRVRTYRGGATIEAVHEYRDPWGRIERVYHHYGLRDTGRQMEITHFKFEK